MYATKEESTLIDRYILYPMILTILDRDLKTIQKAPFKFTQPYEQWIEYKMREVSLTLHEIRKEMKSRNIKVALYRRVQDTSEYNVLVRGYDEVIKYSNLHLRNQAELYLQHLFLDRLPSNMSKPS
ncbi:hypothetical protein [Alkalihalobacillus sp. AL-G]|uniref:hypothetical protein n=1 Tax=Alkalihalobacillus sp. AL-G TaxID=2926399 RepID=UPI00272B667A|nr:hypothetical protein [Alkalihalobacillus sp. AL-G]WLD94836.1 hypothetical protein MOJ78_08135 [Alkalihalobacillus sp. AL-G]